MSNQRSNDGKVACVYFHEDSYRQATKRKCRLIERNPNSEPWHYGLCGSCPVAGILSANPCRHLVLEAKVVRKMGFLQRVQPYAVCTAKLIELNNPDACWKGCDQFAPVQ